MAMSVGVWSCPMRQSVPRLLLQYLPSLPVLSFPIMNRLLFLSGWTRLKLESVVCRSFVKRMSFVLVRSVEGEENLTLSFTYGGKQRKMQRNKGEILSKTLTRIELSTRKKDKKARKRNASETAESVVENASLWFNGELVDSSLTNGVAWKDGTNLKIGEICFPVAVNPPTVKSLLLPENTMSGFPVMPLIELEFSTKQHCRYTWLKSTNHNEEQASSIPSSVNDIFTWEEVGNDFLYIPDIVDIGCYLKLVCLPGNEEKLGNAKSEVTSLVAVQAGPGFCPFDTRHMYTKKPISNSASFRIVSYNILADTYAKDEFAQTVLYPYCPPYALDISYRQQLLLKEIPGYNADLICLQECGFKLFHYNLSPALEVMGFESLLRCKGGEIPEGEALFFRQSKFELISQHDVVLSEALLNNPLHSKVLDCVSEMPILLETLLKRNSVAQVALLKVKDLENQFLCVANTHLYFKPYSPHIRMIQAAIILSHVQKVISQFCTGLSNTKSESVSWSQPKVALLFCGDLNSNPRAGLIQLLTTGEVKSTHRDWTICEDNEQHCTSLTLSHDFELFSACGFPPYTNYTGGFKGTLDYIFADKKHFEVEAVIPLPSEEEVNCHLALPSVVLPSDHLALVCDLKWRL